LELNHRRDFIKTFKNFISHSLINSKSEPDHIQMIIKNRLTLEEDSDEVLDKKKSEDAFDPVSKINNMFKDKELISIIQENMNKVLEIIRDTNIPTASFLYSQILLKLVLISQYYEKFSSKNESLGVKNKKMKLKSNEERKTIDYLENFEIIKSYSEKHCERIGREYTKSFLIDYILDKMKLISDK